VIIGRLIPAGTGFNAYEELSALSEAVDDAVFDDDVRGLEGDAVLDDETARRAYVIESRFDVADVDDDFDEEVEVDEDDFVVGVDDDAIGAIESDDDDVVGYDFDEDDD